MSSTAEAVPAHLEHVPANAAFDKKAYQREYMRKKRAVKSPMTSLNDE